MKYKLIKTTKITGQFTIDKIYHIFPYKENLFMIFDDSGQKHILNIVKDNFNEHFISVNKERKEKLIQIGI